MTTSNITILNENAFLYCSVSSEAFFYNFILVKTENSLCADDEALMLRLVRVLTDI